MQPTEDAAIHLRIGGHVALVLAHPLDLFGDGVNLAARLADLDEPVRAFKASPMGSETPPMPATHADFRHALAVIPFGATDGEPAHRAPGHAMADDIIASLSRHPGLRVLSRPSTAPFQQRDLDLRELRRLTAAATAAPSSMR